MNIKRVSKYLMIIVGIAIVVLLVAGYSSAKSDRREAVKNCNTYAVEQSNTRNGMVTHYESFYVSCMRASGYLQDAREIESN